MAKCRKKCLFTREYVDSIEFSFSPSLDLQSNWIRIWWKCWRKIIFEEILLEKWHIAPIKKWITTFLYETFNHSFIVIKLTAKLIDVYSIQWNRINELASHHFVWFFFPRSQWFLRYFLGCWTWITNYVVNEWSEEETKKNIVEETQNLHQERWFFLWIEWLLGKRA